MSVGSVIWLISNADPERNYNVIGSLTDADGSVKVD
jgi:hypothetical protein